ncbi:MAG: 30S ribosomal protein S20 [candidate division Zixibacteria bacterium]|nr:30S ribosomal protein S20 [candidate division Zixibacteria bacterium]
MPTHKSVKKRLRQSKKANIQNRSIKSEIKTFVKKVEASLDEKDLKETVSLLDKAARKRVVHKNQASRVKSRLTKLVTQKASGSPQEVTQ